jgi:hypothetical protein
MSCTIKNLFSIEHQSLGIYTPYLLSVATCSKETKAKKEMRRKEGLSPKEHARFKARLVEKGFSQILGIDCNDVFSPFVKHSSTHAFFGILAMHDLELEQLDVKNAFLYGLKEEIYMDQS